MLHWCLHLFRKRQGEQKKLYVLWNIIIILKLLLYPTGTMFLNGKETEWSTNHAVKCLLQLFNALKLEEELLISPVSLQIINVLSIHIISHPKNIQFCTTTTKILIIKQKNWVIKHMWDAFKDLLSLLLMFYILISKIIHVLPHQVCPLVKDHLSQDFWCSPPVVLDYHPCWPDLKTKWVAKYSNFVIIFFFFFLH